MLDAGRFILVLTLNPLFRDHARGYWRSKLKLADSFRLKR